MSTPQSTNGETRRKAAVEMTRGGGFQINDIDQAYRAAVAIVASGLAPHGDTPEKVMVKMAAGAELGLPPIRSLTSITVVKGRMGLMGDVVLARVRNSGLFEYVNVGNDAESTDDLVSRGDTYCGYVVAKRRGEQDEVRVAFNVADAKRAGLDSKDVWKGYPDDMLIWKAVSRFGKRYASDLLMGFDVTEVLHDLPPRGDDDTADAPPAAEPDPLLSGALPDGIEDAVTAPVEDGEQLDLTAGDFDATG